MSRLVKYFLQGLLLVAPIAVTIYVCWLIFITIDRWLGIPVRGAGFLVTLVLITLIGFAGSTFLSRKLLGALERIMQKVPLVRLLYSSTKDLLSALVGEKKRFDRPVLVTVISGQLQLLGFITQESLDGLGLAGHVAVYIPQSYNFAGNLVIVPKAAVVPVAADSSAVMAFIVSGGVTDVPGMKNAV
jgi:uncharacterized membrane protein